MIIDLPGFDFEKPRPSTVAIEPLFDKIRQFLDTKGVSREEYALEGQFTAGFGELVIRQENNFWVVHTTERGENFDVAIFSNEFYAINYFTFRLTGEKETIDWTNI